MVPPGSFFGLVALVALAAACGALAEEEGGGSITGPLDVQILFPANDTAFAVPSFTAVVEADGQTADATIDDFVNGTFVNTSFDTQGLRANASGPTNESYYLSRVFEQPPGPGPLVWSSPLDFLTSGSSANLTQLLLIEARTGDRTPGRNWSNWFPVDAGGDYGDPRGPANEPLLELPALQYRIRFLDPFNASSPRVVLVEVWSLARIVEVAARVGGAASWTVLGTAAGQYNFSVTLAPGTSALEAQVRDASGAVRTARAEISYDIVAPQVESAPPSGSAIPEDAAAEIRFSEPMDRASASTNVVVEAPFQVDLVWSADNRTLFVSAQESGMRSPVKITLGAGLRDRAGNTLGSPISYTYEMGKLAEPLVDKTPTLIVLFAAIAVAGVAAMVLSSKARKQNLERAAAGRTDLEAEDGGAKPPE